MLLLNTIYSILKSLGFPLEDPSVKHSHCEKVLSQHCDETKKICQTLLKLYDLSQLTDFIKSLCEIHDIGKLHPNWSLSGKSISHISAGMYFLNQDLVKQKLMSVLSFKNNEKSISPKELLEFLLYFVKIHHSLISPHLARNFWNLKKFVRRTHPLIFKLTDAFGIFKLADIISASYRDNELVAFVKGYTKEYALKDIIQKIREMIVKTCNTKGILFDHNKFELQKDIARKSGIHVLIAPTGWGKTAFSLMKAFQEHHPKIFYILPTITAIRRFYNNIKSKISDVGEYFYYADIDLISSRRTEEDPSEYVKLLNSYRLFIPKINITTIDQIFLSMLNFGKYHLRRFCFRKAFLIFDEFHLLTPKIIQLIKALIDIYGREYKFNLLLMSATPSLAYIKFLKDSIEENLGSRVFFSIENYEKIYEKLRRHKIDLWLEKKIENSEVIERIIEKYKVGLRVLIIVNTVSRAIKLFEILKEVLENQNERGDRVVLIHSRFAMKDRQKREEEIDSARILIATQVAEVSLDISFDILFTEIAPIPALIQRFGRVNRYSEKEKGTDFNVIIVNVPSYSPYDSFELSLYRTKKLLEEYIPGVNKSGEIVYLEMIKENDTYIEKILGKNSRLYDNARRALKEKSKFFYAFTEREESAIRIWRERDNILAIPECYRPKVEELKNQLISTRDYSIRRKILTEMKKYFIPVPIRICNRYFDPDLRFYVIPEAEYPYDLYIGLRS